MLIFLICYVGNGGPKTPLPRINASSRPDSPLGLGPYMGSSPEGHKLTN